MVLATKSLLPVAAVVTPAPVEPNDALPVAPLPPAPLLRTSHSYPLAGAGEGAVHERLAAVDDDGVPLRAVGARHEGGDQVNLNPLAGLTVFE